jgi:hypothetical protein
MGQRDVTGLLQVQRFVADALQRPAPLDGQLAAQVDALVVPSARGMSPTERLEVYRDQFWIRHLRNLADDFPTLAWALGGAAAFTDLAGEFLRACPPRTWDLQRLGASMPAFVADHPRLGGDVTARDAARLDWAFMDIFDAPDAAPFDPRVLASTPEDAWPGARVQLHPAVRLLALGSPLLGVRDALKSEASAQPDRPAPAATPVVVWRDAACFPRSVAIEAAPFALLLRLSRGEALGAACEAVALESGPDAAVADHVGAWFQDWVQRGWLSRVIVD